MGQTATSLQSSLPGKTYLVGREKLSPLPQAAKNEKGGCQQTQGHTHTHTHTPPPTHTHTHIHTYRHSLLETCDYRASQPHSIRCPQPIPHDDFYSQSITHHSMCHIRILFGYQVGICQASLLSYLSTYYPKNGHVSALAYR